MNLFDILSAGKRDLNEENISSFLAWLLDPHQSHGCGDIFLSRLLKKLGIKHDFRSSENVKVTIEEEVATKEGKTRSIDVVIDLDGKRCVAIENKIRTGAADREQPREECDGFKRTENWKDYEMSFLYLTPGKTKSFIAAFDLIPSEIKKHHMIWAEQEPTPDGDSFAGILRSVLSDDTEARIDPLSQETRFILKSFVRFAEKGFRSEADTSFRSIGQSRYYEGITNGLNGLEDLRKERKDIEVGFLGGEKAIGLEDPSYLIVRPYKWRPSSGKKERNWIPLDNICRILRDRIGRLD